MDFPGVNVWCGLSYLGLIVPFFFGGIITSKMYFQKLETSNSLPIKTYMGMKGFSINKMVPQSTTLMVSGSISTKIYLQDG